MNLGDGNFQAATEQGSLPKLYVLCAVLNKKGDGSFAEEQFTWTCQVSVWCLNYKKKALIWSGCKMGLYHIGFIMYLDENLPQCWFSLVGQINHSMLRWPPRTLIWLLTIVLRLFERQHFCTSKPSILLKLREKIVPTLSIDLPTL